MASSMVSQTMSIEEGLRTNSKSSLLSRRRASSEREVLRTITNLTDNTNSDTSEYVNMISCNSSGETSPTTPVPKELGIMPDVRHDAPKRRPSKILQTDYKMRNDVIGRGAYGVVTSATCKDTNEKRAIKSITLAKLKSLDGQRDQELLIAWQMNHPFIIHVFETFQDDDNLYLVMELCGGNLFDRIVGVDRASRRNNLEFRKRGLPLATAARFSWQILSGIAYLHHHRICHRDVKPENYLLSSSPPERLKLIDFGFACRFHRGTPMTERIGSSYSVAPEVIASPASYTEKCDIWSVGTVCFFMCVGHPPFVGKNKMDCLRKVASGSFTFEAEEWDAIDAQAKKVVGDMMTFDTQTRPSAKRLIDDNAAWLKEAGKRKEAQACKCIIS